MNTKPTEHLSNPNLNAIKRLLLAVAAVLVMAATGCKNTAHGVGQDVEKAGEKIQEKTQ